MADLLFLLVGIVWFMGGSLSTLFMLDLLSDKNRRKPIDMAALFVVGALVTLATITLLRIIRVAIENPHMIPLDNKHLFTPVIYTGWLAFIPSALVGGVVLVIVGARAAIIGDIELPEAEIVTGVPLSPFHQGITWLVLLIWMPLGFFYWVPLMIRSSIAFVVFLVHEALLSSGHIGPARAALDRAIRFYPDGFLRISSAAHGARQKRKATVDTGWLAVGVETLWALIVWIGIVTLWFGRPALLTTVIHSISIPDMVQGIPH
jgi:hypothetical protein